MRKEVSIKFIKAIINNDIEEITVTLEKYKKNEINLNLNEKDENGNYPVLCACKNNDEKLVTLLLDCARNKNVNLKLDEKNNKGKSPLIYAREHGNKNIIKQLMEYGDDTLISKGKFIYIKYLNI